MLVGAISISSFFSFWKLDYFSDMTCLKNPLSDMISCSFSTQLITHSNQILKSDIDPGYIHWTLTPLRLEKFQLKFSQYMCYIIWESRCTKIIVARLLKLIVLYICIDESVWHSNTELKFFRTRFVKRLRPAEKAIFQIM